MTRPQASGLPGFFLSGFLLALLGAALPGWNYHVTEQHARAGWLFFASATGIFIATLPFLASVSTRTRSLAACSLALSSLLFPAFLPQPVRFEIQLTLSLLLGFSAGLLNVALFHSSGARYRTDPTGTITRAGLYFGAGCFAASASFASAFRWSFVSRTPAVLAVAPALFLVGYLRFPLRNESRPAAPNGGVLRVFSAPGAIVFALLLLFQSGSEWTVSGWLPLFLTHRVGLSPEDALWMLALFWLTLSLARGLTVFLLKRASHSRLLFTGAGCAVVGCLLLISTDNMLGATAAILLIAVGFAAVYPLLAGRVGSRFPPSDPDALNSLLSLSLVAGMLCAWLAGLLASQWSLAAITILPAAATVLVVVLLLVLWLESKVTGR